MIYLQELSFFSHFPKPLVEQLQKAAVLIKVKKGDVIIAQGQPNSCLYFLLKGLLKVEVDGGKVAELKTEGDLIGEMSLISRQNSTASIIADSNAELIKIDGDLLHGKAAQMAESSEYNLYKIYSDILVQKLSDTNQRAKKIEAFAKDLEAAQDKLEAVNASLELKVKDRTAKMAASMEELKQKNGELRASHDKITELYQSRDQTFFSLEKLLNKNLIPLRESLSDFKLSHNIKGDDLGVVEKELARAIHRLEPLSASFRAEKSMSSKKVLLGESNKKQHSVAKMALGGTGVQLVIVEHPDEARLKLATGEYDIFMFGEDFLNLADFGRSKNPDLRCVFVTSKDVPQYVPTLLAHSYMPNVVSRDEEDKQFTIKNFVTTISKLASGNYFGLEKYISWGIEVKEIEVTSSKDRSEIISRMNDYFSKMSIRSSNRDRMAVVAEELLMNAIYDAPAGPDGKPLYNHKDRTEDVLLDQVHRPLFRYATDGNLMAVSVEDPFGLLTAGILFRYLEKCYTGRGSLNDGRKDKGGGGRGLHQIIENSNLVVFNIDPGKRTEVIALFDTDQKRVAHRNPNLHFFSV